MPTLVRLLSRLRNKVVGLLAAAVLTTTYSVVASPVSLQMVRVEDAGNVADTTSYGAVNYVYQIGKYEVTISQYVEFLNAVARTDAYGLYNSNMANHLNVAGVSRSGVSGDYSYSVVGPSGATNGQSAGNRPITYVSWFDTARFANWMSNGQPTGPQDATTTEAGAYALNGAVSGNAVGRSAINPNTGSEPVFRIPTENEWYKAAYYSPDVLQFGGYYTYGTQSYSIPSNSLSVETNAANFQVPVFVGGWHGTQYQYSVTQSWVYSDAQNYLTDVGAFRGTKTFYGTFDQTGNVEEWTDLTGAGGRDRGFRGGSFLSIYENQISKASRPLPFPEYEFAYVGFRLAAPVPEPSTYAMALVGLACASYSMFRRRKRA